MKPALSTAVLLVAVCRSLLAAEGGRIIRIPDGLGAGSCINASTDEVYLTVRGLVTEKRSQWFTSDKSVGVLMKTTVNAVSGSPVTFPLMSNVNISDYQRGQIFVPVEYGVVRGFPLKQTGANYTNFSVDVTLVNKRGKNAWGKALDALVEVSQKAPIPNNPIASGAGYLLKFANSAVDKEIAAQDAKDKLTSASLNLNFDRTGQCKGRTASGGDWERMGTIAVVQSTGEPGAGFVDISRIDQYCFRADFVPAFDLKVAPKDSGLECTSPEFKPVYHSITNNYLGFYLNAQAASPTAGGVDSKRAEAIKRCEAHGVKASDCLKR